MIAETFFAYFLQIMVFVIVEHLPKKMSFFDKLVGIAMATPLQLGVIVLVIRIVTGGLYE